MRNSGFPAGALYSADAGGTDEQRRTNMQIGVIGLGRMGANISRRLMRAGHSTVVWDANAATVQEMGKEGAQGVGSLQQVVQALKDQPRAVWVMLPAGRITEQTINQLGELMDSGDIVIDGGNTFYKDNVRRAKTLAAKGIRYVDCGTSGGVGDWNAATA